MKRQILCFAPHPDDEILGCGGSLIKAKKLGINVDICYLTYGENASPQFSSNQLKAIRKKEALSVCDALGLSNDNIVFLDIPDNQISEHDFDSMKKIIALIRRVKPDIIYLPHERESYYDHRQANLLIQRAIGMSGSNNFNVLGKAWWVPNVLGYEISTPMEKYQYAEDISDYINKKISILKLYKSQTKNYGNASDFINEKSKYLSGYRAAMSIGEFREVFQIITTSNIL